MRKLNSKPSRSKRVLILCHVDLVPPGGVTVKRSDRMSCDWITELDVLSTLSELGHEIEICGVWNSASKVEVLINQFKPDVVFNLMEEFNGSTDNEHSACGLIEMLGIPITGASSKNLLICRDKSLAKIILKDNLVPTPNHFTVSVKEKITKEHEGKLNFPVIVKCLDLEASTGLSKSSVVTSDEKLKERVEWIQRKYKSSVICEEFIEGKDIYLGVIINKHGILTLPPWKVSYKNSEDPDKEIYGEREKWSEISRKKKGITTGPLRLSEDKIKEVERVGLETIKALGLTGYIRIDIRLSKDWIPYVLEVNPNPNIAKDDEFAESAKYMGIPYKDLLDIITFEKPFQRYISKTQKLREAS